MNKVIFCWLVCCGTIAIAGDHSHDLSDAIKKSDKAKVVEILMARKDAVSDHEKAFAAEIRAKRHEKKLNRPACRASIISNGVIVGGAIAYLGGYVLFAAGLGMVLAGSPNAGLGTALIGKLSTVCGKYVFIGGVVSKIFFHYKSKWAAKRKYADACSIDDMLKNRRHLFSAEEDGSVE